MSKPVWYCVFAAFFFVTPHPLAGQVVMGRAVDAANGKSVADVTIHLVNTSGDTVASALTNRQGRFILVGWPPDWYKLVATSAGYASTVSQAIRLDSAVVELELPLSVEPYELQALNVITRPLDRVLLGRGYYERKAMYGERMGFAHFLEREDITRHGANKISGILRSLPGIKLSYTGGRTFSIVGRRGCSPTVYLDGVAMGLNGQDLDEVVSTSSLKAVEVYPGMVTSFDFPGRKMASCGVVVLWTGYTP